MAPSKILPTVLFYRDFRAYSGGHQKIFDYYCYLRDAGYQTSITFSPDTRWDESNPWFAEKDSQISFNPGNANGLFLAGTDWQQYLEAGFRPELPVINLIQHVRHADPDSDVYPYLNQHAIRICVSAEVEKAILATGKVVGPTFVNPNGIAIPVIPKSPQYDVFISDLKQPGIALEVRRRLEAMHYSVRLVSGHQRREDFLKAMAESRVALLLPHEREGFYLPALEAMALCEIVVVPDCVGNRDFCKPLYIDLKRSQEGNCLMPSFDVDDLVAACIRAKDLTSNRPVLDQLQRNMQITVKQHSLEQERDRFLDIMTQLPKLWTQ